MYDTQTNSRKATKCKLSFLILYKDAFAAKNALCVYLSYAQISARASRSLPFP